MKSKGNRETMHTIGKRVFIENTVDGCDIITSIEVMEGMISDFLSIDTQYNEKSNPYYWSIIKHHWSEICQRITPRKRKKKAHKPVKIEPPTNTLKLDHFMTA